MPAAETLFMRLTFLKVATGGSETIGRIEPKYADRSKGNVALELCIVFDVTSLRKVLAKFSLKHVPYNSIGPPPSLTIQGG